MKIIGRLLESEEEFVLLLKQAVEITDIIFQDNNYLAFLGYEEKEIESFKKRYQAVREGKIEEQKYNTTWETKKCLRYVHYARFENEFGCLEYHFCGDNDYHIHSNSFGKAIDGNILFLYLLKKSKGQNIPLKDVENRILPDRDKKINIIKMVVCIALSKVNYTRALPRHWYHWYKARWISDSLKTEGIFQFPLLHRELRYKVVRKIKDATGCEIWGLYNSLQGGTIWAEELFKK